MAKTNPRADWRADNCRDASRHTPCPTGYLQWCAWADAKAKTHKQVRCPTCGLLVIWVPKED